MSASPARARASSASPPCGRARRQCRSAAEDMPRHRRRESDHSPELSTATEIVWKPTQCSAQADQTAIRIRCQHRDRSAELSSPTLARGRANRGTPFCMDKLRSGGLLSRSASLIAAKCSRSARCRAVPSFHTLKSVDAPAWLSLPRTSFLKLMTYCSLVKRLPASAVI